MSAQRRGFISGYYFVMFMTVGVSLPFMPGYFQTLGFSGAEAGALLSIGPAFSLVMPPLWGHLADRWRRPGLVLTLTSAGGALGFALLARADTFAAAFIALAVHAAFASSLTSLADAIAFHHLKQHGGTFSNIRIWGSVGFVLTALPFGFFVTTVDRVAVVVPLALMTCAAVWSGLTLRHIHVEVAAGPPASLANAVSLVKRRPIALFLIATCLHWIACAPYHGSLAPHVNHLGLPTWVIGVSASVGVISEILVMMTWARWSARFSTTRILAACFVASAARWAFMSAVDSPALLSLAAVLHGLTFGAFYVASVSFMASQVPESLRATGQALFAAATFGVGGVVGYRVAGRLYDSLGGSQLFLLAGLFALTPLIPLAFAAMPARSQPT